MPMRETQNFARPLQRVEPLLRFANSFENIRQGFCTSSLDQSNSKLVRVSTNIEETSEELPRNFRYAPSAPWLDRPSWKTWGICTQRAGKLYKARSRLYRNQMFCCDEFSRPALAAAAATGGTFFFWWYFNPPPPSKKNI